MANGEEELPDEDEFKPAFNTTREAADWLYRIRYDGSLPLRPAAEIAEPDWDIAEGLCPATDEARAATDPVTANALRLERIHARYGSTDFESLERALQPDKLAAKDYWHLNWTLEWLIYYSHMPVAHQQAVHAFLAARRQADEES